jgi:excinuclease ABC subunit B
MARAIDETYRRRTIQITHNRDNGITAETIQKSLRDIREMVADELKAAEAPEKYEVGFHEVDDLSPLEAPRRIRELEGKMRLAADALEFEKAAKYRDEIDILRDSLELAKP